LQMLDSSHRSNGRLF